MDYPSLVAYKTEAEYEEHYINKYCKSPLISIDCYQVSFGRDRFSHAFYRSSHRNKIKDCFSSERAERIDWIETALSDPDADLRMGYDNTKKRDDANFRVAIVVKNYVVVIRIISRLHKTAKFVTAYIADEDALPKILKSPKWE